MLQKNPKPQHRRFIKTGAKILFVVEAVAFAVSYGVYYKLNHERDFRYYMHENYPTVLEGYYKIGETLSSSDRIRQIDTEIWRALEKEQKEKH